MKQRNIIILAVIVLLIVIVFYSFNSSQTDPSYVEEIRKEREEKDRFMKTSKESPLPEAERENFKGLKYFTADSKYKIIANLIPVESKKVVVLSTSDGKEQRCIEYAHATFSLDGVKNDLLILEIIDMGPSRGKLFLAFGDETNADETYGAGRYLDVAKVPGSSTITLDFNRAYNPYCAYNDSFSCPFPPKENLLKIAIKAGEKTYH
ncbi:DUF1684 domain-containing protein [Chryseosolibacter indicus]|uniref:DUF1684 domain-containing protein n=1 Tax=Chryseosolibacter indicus TaxID=2782351 RepID=A0ABS5VPV1_9BACT|nr:DUF1684 domain-containing protein [Chryseosolibacter indicus]MBT1703166.1 DUF1684 domain-containing protein [Chryseosolibacter indicus]